MAIVEDSPGKAGKADRGQGRRDGQVGWGRVVSFRNEGW